MVNMIFEAIVELAITAVIVVVVAVVIEVVIKVSAHFTLHYSLTRAPSSQSNFMVDYGQGINNCDFRNTIEEKIFGFAENPYFDTCII